MQCANDFVLGFPAYTSSFMKTPASDKSIFTRRQFIRTTAAATTAITLGAGLPSLHAARRNKVLPAPNKSGIEHIVVVMMENRSFDHFLGWLPNADGRQSGLSYLDETGVAHPTHPLGIGAPVPDYQGCGFSDPDHSYQGGRIEYNNGACDGWLRAGANDDYCIGYYTQPDLAFLGNAAPAWTTCDHYFTAIMAGTYPNRVYQHAAQTDRLDNSILPFSNLPTIWDRLADHSLQGKYYFSDFPFLALWGTKYIGISHLISEFYDDCANGTLPHVSFVEPRFLGEEQGISADHHPHSDIRNGEVFLNSIYDAVTSSPNWQNTVLIINYDEWGGFFEHVSPTRAPIPPADAALGSDGLRGFRVPALVISPWSPRNTVATGLYDHTSVLKMIEWRWSLRPLTIRDATANNLAEVLDFSRKNLNAPTFTVPAGPFGAPCVPGAVSEFLAAFEAARILGFPVPSL
jgi:phospholipase C